MCFRSGEEQADGGDNLRGVGVRCLFVDNNRFSHGFVFMMFVVNDTEDICCVAMINLPICDV